MDLQRQRAHSLQRQPALILTLATAAHVTLDFSANQNHVLTLTGNVTLVNPGTEIIGQSGFIVFIQDGTGGRTVSLGSDYETAGTAGLTLSSAASTTDIVPYVVAADQAASCLALHNSRLAEDKLCQDHLVHSNGCTHRAFIRMR